MMEQYQSIKDEYIKTSTADLGSELESLREEISAFQFYPELSVLGIPWAEENNEFLSQIGLPCSAPSMLEFRPPKNIGQRYIDIGFNNYGDRVCIDSGTGNVIYINHDNRNQICYINSDPISLFLSICSFARFLHISQETLDEIKESDPDAALPGNWWHQQYIDYSSVED
jgi:hypothetical protein